MTSTTSTVRPIEAVPAARINRGPPDGLPIFVDPTLKPWRPDDEVIEEFPFDDELFFRDKLACEACIDIAWIAWWLPIWLPCCLLKWSNADLNAADLAYSRWVAVSKENIYIVRRKRKGDMRCSCCDMAEMRKTIPINNVQDIMITEPAAYAVCDCCVANVLTSIKVETAGNAGDGGINDPSVGLLMGMTDPQRFRTVVLNLKRGVYTCSPPASPRRLRRRPRWTRSAGRLARQVCPPSVPRSPAAPPREALTRSRPPRPRAARRSRRCSARCSPRCRASTRG